MHTLPENHIWKVRNDNYLVGLGRFLKEEVSKLRLEGSAAITQIKRRNKIVLSGGVTAEILSVVTQWWRLGGRSRQVWSWKSEQTASDHPALLYREEVDLDPILRIIVPISQIHFDLLPYSYTLRDFPTVTV